LAEGGTDASARCNESERVKKMKKTRKMLSLILAVVMLCSVFAAATSAFAANSGPYSYELINDGKEVKITAYNENKAILSIPSRIAGKPVTVIGSYAFSRIGRRQNVYVLRRGLQLFASDGGRCRIGRRYNFQTDFRRSFS